MNQKLYIAKEPEFAWKCELISEIILSVEEGKQPNAFHRFMQRLVFGFKWSRIE